MFIEMMVVLMLHYKPVNFSGIKVLNPYLNIYTHEFKKNPEISNVGLEFW